MIKKTYFSLIAFDERRANMHLNPLVYGGNFGDKMFLWSLSLKDWRNVDPGDFFNIVEENLFFSEADLL